ncbi:TPA: glycosyltransferase family 2 protein [Pseudomonas aeruginosa]|uniref:Glycosyl transferase family protein n=2 Tax=Alcaligenaceae TaxID=506 RepID=A0A157SET2_9BORD|nr:MULTISPECIES: glycosyltransferase family 2 protein [Alcaligenaceae]QCS62037.1 glycosyltransferase family 2 protein [Achromobacter denitrificans]TFL08014.1 glycosyltransferase [Pusillimonas caeni]CUJ51759.1 Bactoprenol glucosyl transferase homolog from prophage CPS-53 [Achromobacter xylosoxidans]CUJ74749.1 Bactoprenol glucosyl transferase homolog from prophage CPS-53 [Achromobacter xylosoxidans]SAI68945.1 glycosyl transferase family protein [Bordetella ansorpii]
MNALVESWRPESQRESKIELSIVIPLYNEYEVITMMHERLSAVLASLDISYQLVLIDDGSRDGTPNMLNRLAEVDSAVKAVFLSRNFGKEAALTAGLDHAAGDAVIIMDADLQDPPELIPEMLRAWKGGADVVCMRRRSRAGESWLKRYSAHRFYRVLNAISEVDIPADTGDFRLLSRKAVDALSQLNERNRYMKGLFAWIGLPTTVIEYDRLPRAAGVTKWDYLSLFNLAFQGITSFSTAPLRLAMAAGLLTALFGVLFTLWIVFKALVLGDPVQGYPSLISMITILGGAQLLSIGLLGEYLGKTYYETKQRPVYLVREVVSRRNTVNERESTPPSTATAGKESYATYK